MVRASYGGHNRREGGRLLGIEALLRIALPAHPRALIGDSRAYDLLESERPHSSRFASH